MSSNMAGGWDRITKLKIYFLSLWYILLSYFGISYYYYYYYYSIRFVFIFQVQYINLVGGLEDFLFFHILGMSSSQLTFTPVDSNPAAHKVCCCFTEASTAWFADLCCYAKSLTLFEMPKQMSCQPVVSRALMRRHDQEKWKRVHANINVA